MTAVETTSEPRAKKKAEPKRKRQSAVVAAPAPADAPAIENEVLGEAITRDEQPADPEPEPQPPADLQKALAASPAARGSWEDTTTIARVDWIHWIESAKQDKTRKHRVDSACDMLSSGKKRVCCFDESGFYSKSLRAPQAAD